MKLDRAKWMSGRAGIMVHWIAPGPWPEIGERISDLDRAVDAFNLPRFLDQVDQMNPEWVVFTLGQNTGYYASPNATLDALAGPGHASKRDLALEMATALK